VILSQEEQDRLGALNKQLAQGGGSGLTDCPDLQHHAMKLLLGGALATAPIAKPFTGNVLDFGTGTGICESNEMLCPTLYSSSLASSKIRFSTNRRGIARYQWDTDVYQGQ
jgi:hypothetical protein